MRVNYISNFVMGRVSNGSYLTFAFGSVVYAGPKIMTWDELTRKFVSVGV